MIRIAARGLAALLLEIAAIASILAVVTLVLSAYLTARVVGITPKVSRRTAMALRLTRDGMALAMKAKREKEANDGDS